MGTIRKNTTLSTNKRNFYDSEIIVSAVDEFDNIVNIKQVENTFTLEELKRRRARMRDRKQELVAQIDEYNDMINQIQLLEYVAPVTGSEEIPNP